MKLIRTEDAVGHVLCHDLTQIIKDQYKDARFRKGHVVAPEDIPVLLGMGKEHLYVWKMTPGMLHEDEGAERLLALCANENMERSGVKEGKIEVKQGLIQDTFTPVVKDKLSAYGIETISVSYSGDGVENVAGAISQARQTGAEVILCTGGMSVDPDDNTPGGIRQSGAKIVTYGAPVLPGAMFLLGYYDDGTPVMGLPGCVMYAGATIFDLVLPWVAADVSVTKEWIVSLGEGGLCLGCQPCRWPIGPFGK